MIKRDKFRKMLQQAHQKQLEIIDADKQNEVKINEVDQIIKLFQEVVWEVYVLRDGVSR